MRITHVITGLETGGAETALRGLLAAMAGLPGEGFEQRVVSLIEPGFMGPRIRELGVSVESLGMRRGAPTPGSLFRLAGLLRSHRPHAVMTWLYHADLLGLLAAGLSGRPPLAWNLRCAFMDFSQYSSLTRLTVRACVRLSSRPTAVLANSEAAKQHHLALGYHPRRFEVIENGVDIDRFRPDPEARQALRDELGLGGDALLAGAAMRFDPMKNLSGWLDAAALTLDKLPKARFLLCGAGMEPGNADLERLIEERALTGRVLLLGQRGDVERVLAGLDAYLSASTGESFPNSMAEAMACEVPAVVTDVGACRKVAGDTGRVVPSGDAGDLARALATVLSLPEAERAALGRAARERVARMFSMRAMAEAYAAFFRSLISG